MVRITFIFALLLFSAFSCSKEDDPYVDPLEKFPALISRVEAPESAVVGSTVPITVYFTVNNGCGEFGSFDVENKHFGASIIKVYPKYREGFCTMDLPTRQVTYDFKPTTPGTFTLHFWSEHPDVYITKAIVVSADNP